MLIPALGGSFKFFLEDLLYVTITSLIAWGLGTAINWYSYRSYRKKRVANALND